MTHTEQLFIDGCGRSLQAGEEFAIYVDAATPSRFVSDFSDNESPIAVLAAIGALLGGLVLVASSVVRVWRLLRVLSTLRSGSWTQQTCRIVSLPGKVVQRHLIVAMGKPGEAVLIKLAGGGAGFRPSDSMPMVVTRDQGGHWALAKDIGARPVAGKELDNEKMRARALGKLGDSHD